MSLVESGKSILIHICKLCTNEKKKCVWHDTNWVWLHIYSVEYIRDEGIVVFTGIPEKKKMPMIGWTLTNRISVVLIIQPPCISGVQAYSRSLTAKHRAGALSSVALQVCVIHSGCSQGGSFPGSMNNSLVLRAGSVGQTLLAWPLWVMRKYFEVWCYLSYYSTLQWWSWESGIE